MEQSPILSRDVAAVCQFLSKSPASTRMCVRPPSARAARAAHVVPLNKLIRAASGSHLAGEATTGNHQPLPQPMLDAAPSAATAPPKLAAALLLSRCCRTDVPAAVRPLLLPSPRCAGGRTAAPPVLLSLGETRRPAVREKDERER